MSARFEIVRSDAGWHARLRAGNGRIVWVTESLTRRRAAVAAVEFITGSKITEPPAAGHPEVDWAGNRETPTEVHEVDERGAA